MENAFPEWHKKPLNLTIQEIENPKDLLQDFCWEYPIAEIRENLRELLIDALHNDNNNAGKSILFHDKLLKVMEALHIIYATNDRTYF